MIQHLLSAIVISSALGLSAVNIHEDILNAGLWSDEYTKEIYSTETLYSSNKDDGYYYFIYDVNYTYRPVYKGLIYEEFVNGGVVGLNTPSEVFKVLADRVPQYDLVFCVALNSDFNQVGDLYMFTTWYGNKLIGGYTIPTDDDVYYNSPIVYPFTLTTFDSLYDASSPYFQKQYISGAALRGGSGHYQMNYQSFYYSGIVPSTYHFDFSFNFHYYLDYYQSSWIYYDGFEDGSYTGWDVGYEDGIADGRELGYHDGYEDGMTASGGLSINFLGLLGAIADTPVLVIRNLYSFDLFGVSALTIFMSILTAIIVIHFIRKYL